MPYIVKAGKEFKPEDVEQAAKDFAVIAHELFVKNNWLYLNAGEDGFKYFDSNKMHVPDEAELVEVMLGHWETHKRTQTSYGISSGMLRLEPRPNGMFRFDVWEEATKER